MKMEGEKFVDRARRLVGFPNYISVLTDFTCGQVFGTTLEMDLESEDVTNIWTGVTPRVMSLLSQYKNSEEIDITSPLIISIVDYINEWKKYAVLFGDYHMRE